MIGLLRRLSRERYSRDEAMIALGAPGRVVSALGRKTHYVVRGAGPPVVLVHGFFYHSFMWRETIEALAPRFTCYALDLLGFGWSEKPAAPRDVRYGYDLWSEHLEGFLAALEIPRARLVGQSLGAGTILALGARRPDLVERAVLVCPAGIPNPKDRDSGSVLTRPVLGEVVTRLPGLALTKKILRDYFIHDPARVTDAYAAEVARPSAIRGSAAAGLWIMRHVDLGGIEDRVRAFGERGLRSMLVWGEDDAAIPVANCAKVAALVHPERTLLIPRAGHVPHQERPELANPAILEYLSTTGASPSPRASATGATA
ncbi:MAG TPA: alpha/beta fold hydrolase [Planctomycetota bacterium]|nr:alpha/beta fold hydrolase [Planctomycetota bacterium]